jgi:DNA replication protein DnaC
MRRLAMLVDAEWLDRQNKKLARNLREAKLRLSQAAVEDIEYPAQRKLEKSVIRQLAACKWIEAHQNVIITGMTGPTTYCNTSLRS